MHDDLDDEDELEDSDLEFFAMEGEPTEGWHDPLLDTRTVAYTPTKLKEAHSFRDAAPGSAEETASMVEAKTAAPAGSGKASTAIVEIEDSPAKVKIEDADAETASQGLQLQQGLSAASLDSSEDSQVAKAGRPNSREKEKGMACDDPETRRLLQQKAALLRRQLAARAERTGLVGCMLLLCMRNGKLFRQNCCNLEWGRALVSTVQPRKPFWE